jgi:hypothetical protein
VRQAPIIRQMKATGLVRVYGALELAGLKTAPAVLPAYFVVPEGWTAEANRMSGVHHQPVSEGFGVVIMLNGAALREEQIDESLHVEQARVIEALAGWTHPEASRACDASGGRLLSVSGHTLNWMVSFKTGRTIRKAV